LKESVYRRRSLTGLSCRGARVRPAPLEPVCVLLGYPSTIHHVNPRKPRRVYPDGARGSALFLRGSCSVPAAVTPLLAWDQLFHPLRGSGVALQPPCCSSGAAPSPRS